MKQSALLEFESSAFADEPGEDENTNPGVYGKALAQWLAEQLRIQGFGVGTIVAEDFGWCVPVESKPHSLYVACASTGEKQSEWQVFVFTEGGLMARLFGKDKSSESLASLFNVVKRVLQTSSHVHGLREETQ